MAVGVEARCAIGVRMRVMRDAIKKATIFLTYYTIPNLEHQTYFTIQASIFSNSASLNLQ